VAIAFDLLRDPTRVSIFERLTLKNIPRGARVSVTA
jgi:hypothetical protein